MNWIQLAFHVDSISNDHTEYDFMLFCCFKFELNLLKTISTEWTRLLSTNLTFFLLKKKVNFTCRETRSVGEKEAAIAHGTALDVRVRHWGPTPGIFGSFLLGSWWPRLGHQHPTRRKDGRLREKEKKNLRKKNQLNLVHWLTKRLVDRLNV